MGPHVRLAGRVRSWPTRRLDIPSALHVKGMAQRFESGLLEALTLGRMCVDRSSNVLQARTHLDGETKGCR